MKKNTKRRLSTAVLVMLFLMGLVLAIWPVLTELIAYQADDEEYSEMAVVLHTPLPSPDDAIAIPTTATPTVIPELTQVVPDESITSLAEAEPDEQPTPQPDPGQPATEQSISPMPTSLPESTAMPATMPTAMTTTITTMPVATITPHWEPTASPAPTASTGLEVYLAQNKDFVAWLTIPGTKIDYPVVRSNNTEYYLHHLFSGKESKLGCLFSLKSSDYQTPSKNIAIYGHHLSNSTAMFSTLVKYKDQSYYSTHSTIQLNTLYGVRSYKIFAVLNMNVNDWDAATATFSSDESFQRFVERANKAALYETGVKVGASDHILTLITCDRSYGGASGRLIVMAVEQK